MKNIYSYKKQSSGYYALTKNEELFLNFKIGSKKLTVELLSIYRFLNNVKNINEEKFLKLAENNGFWDKDLNVQIKSRLNNYDLNGFDYELIHKMVKGVRA